MTTEKKGCLAFAVCGSFCTLEDALGAAQALTAQGWTLLPIMSFAAQQDTRFGTGESWRQRLQAVTGQPVLDTLQAVEPLGPRRLAQALGAARDLAALEYNEASSWVECGDYARAEKFFAAFERPGVMELHKLAICREKLGDPAGALEALDRAVGMQSDYPPTELSEQMLALVRLRVEHPDYLRSEAYGRLLLESFARFRKELPSGYALFHRPWVLEWLLAHRQYKEAYAMLAEDNG